MRPEIMARSVWCIRPGGAAGMPKIAAKTRSRARVRFFRCLCRLPAVGSASCPAATKADRVAEADAFFRIGGAVEPERLVAAILPGEIR
jgi:hypothetical protein